MTERGEAKQVSAETTFDTDLSDVVAVRRAVAELAGSAHRRLVASGRAARTVTVKVRGGDFATHTRSETTAVASTDLAALTETAQRLAVAALPDAGVRLVGVSYAGLTTAVQGSLFDDAAERPGGDTGSRRGPGDRRHAAPVAGAVEALPEDDRLAGEEPAPDPERAWRTGDDVDAPRARPRLGPGRRARAGHRAVRDALDGSGAGGDVRERRPGAGARGSAGVAGVGALRAREQKMRS